jgi:hypothetical protein
MTGERDLETLRRHMAPLLHPQTFVYCNFPDFQLPPGMHPICTFKEAEGLTAIVEQSQADRADVPHTFEARLITLTVHSSLESIGLLATVATRLAKAGISCNAVAAYHHDHLFVPKALADQAISVLNSLTTVEPIDAVAQNTQERALPHVAGLSGIRTDR